MTEEITLLRQRLELQLQEAVQETVKSLSERIAQLILNAVVEQATERTAATVAEARETFGGDIDELDAKIRSAAREALSTQGETPLKSPPRKRSRKSSK